MNVGEDACSYRRGRTGVKYKYVCMFDGKYAAHRVAWMLHYGSWPSTLLDHRDGDGCNNKIENLREATKAQNGSNASINKRNTSGVTGVFWEKATKKWRAAIKVNYKCIKLGRFVLFSDAVNARKEAEIKYGFSERHGASKTDLESPTTGDRLP
jgi:N-formylglutamate amidohydrolase